MAERQEAGGIEDHQLEECERIARDASRGEAIDKSIERLKESEPSTKRRKK